MDVKQATVNDNGRPKSRQDRAKGLEAKIDGLGLRIQALSEGDTPREPVDELIDLLRISINVANDALEMGKEDARQIKAELYKTRRELSERGQAIERADLFELRHLAQAGLLDKDVVEGEAVRRREAFSQNLAAGPEQFVGNATVSGFLICGHAGCNRQVLAKDGSRCPEHRKAVPRQYLTANYKAVDLDDALFDAERRARTSRMALEQAEKEIEVLRERIEAYDRAHANGG